MPRALARGRCGVATYLPCPLHAGPPTATSEMPRHETACCIVARGMRLRGADLSHPLTRNIPVLPRTRTRTRTHSHAHAHAHARLAFLPHMCTPPRSVTGTGKGGQSIWGGKFADELSPHLRVRKDAMLCCVLLLRSRKRRVLPTVRQ